MTDDAAHVAACLAGDQSAFEVLVERYTRPLYNAAYRITGCREDAEDVTQTAFVKAYEKLHSYDPAYRFFSWIYRITVNEALNTAHRRRREAVEPDIDTPAPGETPEDFAALAEANNHLQRALLHLQPDHRAVVVLRHFGGLSYPEMAVVLGIPAKTVKSRLFEARTRLREVLVERGVIQ